jgi:hypothetical protein
MGSLRRFSVVVALALPPAVARAQTGALDQVSPNTGAGIALLPSTLTWQQQFHVGTTGYLEGVVLHLGGDAGAQVDVRLRAGAGWNTTPAWIQRRVTKSITGLEAIFVPCAGAVSSLNPVAVFELANASGSIFTVGSYVAPPGAPLYSDPLFLNGGPGCFSDCGWRIAFETYVVSQPHVSSYCSAGTTTNGCVPAISGVGTPSWFAGSGFWLTTNNVEGQKLGLSFFSFAGPTSVPWLTGSTSYLCVRSPVLRMPTQNSLGTAGSCNGVLSSDWNAYAIGHIPPMPGQGVWAQSWFRDPPSPATSNLSDGLFFVP